MFIIAGTEKPSALNAFAYTTAMASVIVASLIDEKVITPIKPHKITKNMINNIIMNG